MHVLDGEARGDRSGTVLADHFDLLKKIGSGGMGDVYEARFRPDRRRYALKLLTGAPARDPILVARFEHEYRALSQIRHRAIVRVFFFGVLPSGERFYTMELLRGATLEELVRRGPLAPSRVVTIGIQLCKALARLHARGVIHRDLKPANVFVLRGDKRRPGPRRDRIKLLDLGIAKLTAAFYTSDANATPPENRLRTRAGVILGTPGYIAPELLHGDRDPQPRHDVFALGVTLYKLATGASPYAHPHAAAVGDPPRPAPNLPRALAQILHRAVAADPSRRYPSMAELQDDLELLHEELAAVANTGETSPRRPSNPSTPRHRLGADAPRDPSPPAELSAHTGASLSARSRASSASPTSTPRAAHLRRSLPWLVAAVLALGWLADARLLDTQPGDLITGTQAHAATILRAAEIALPTIQPSTALAPEAGHAETTTDSPDAHASATGFSTTQTDPAASAPLPLRSEPRAPATLAPPAAVDSEFAPPRTTPAAANRPGRAATSDPTRAGPPPRPARTRTDLLRAVTDRRAALDLCLPGDGLIDLRLAIAADGHLLRATTIPAGSTIAQECVAEALADLRLPAAGAPSTHTIHLRER